MSLVRVGPQVEKSTLQIMFWGPGSNFLGMLWPMETEGRSIGGLGVEPKKSDTHMGPFGDPGPQISGDFAPRPSIGGPSASHMDPKWIQKAPKIHWGPYGPIWEFLFFGSYIGSTWDPT